MATRSPIRTQRSWQSTTKRQILGTFQSSDNNKFDGSNADQIKMLVEDLQAKYDSIIQALETDLHQHKMMQEETLSTGLVKLPKSIKQMTVREFNESHKCDILALLKQKDGVVVAAKQHQKKRDYQGMVAETPSVRPRNPGTNSVLRTVMKGEGLYSQNGSPLEKGEIGSVIATVTKKPRRGNAPAEQANFEINVGDGKYISLNDPSGVDQLDSNMKATAATQLKVLQDQMASLMAQLNN